jgi:hypothetical protein
MNGSVAQITRSLVAMALLLVAAAVTAWSATAQTAAQVATHAAAQNPSQAVGQAPGQVAARQPANRPIFVAAATNTGPGAPFVPGLDDNRVQMVVAQQDLAKTLEILSEQTQLKFTMSKGLKGTTSRLRIDGTGRAALDAVANQVGAIWWWNGSEVRLAARNDTVSHSIKARDIDYAISSARGLGMPMDLLAISKPSGRQNVRVSGPSGLVADFEALNEEISGRLSNINVTRFGRRRVVKVE